MKFISDIEKNNGILSVIKFESFDLKFIDFILKHEFEIVYEELSYRKKFKPKIDTIIFKTKQNFYLELVRKGNFFLCSIYYKPNQSNELIVFIKQIIDKY